MSPRRPEPTYAVAIIGGATAGAEAARIFSDAGILAVVFEQNDRPYGKVEDGLPRWHVNLRLKEFRAIDEKLDHPLVHFVPRTKLGEDVGIAELLEDWGFSAVVLANGAWRDRPLPLHGIDQFVGRGLLYQNPVIYWFNHEHEPGYDGPRFEIPDGSIVIGGGLASIDVAKVCQFAIVQRALAERGTNVGMLELDERGIGNVLAEHDLTWDDLGLKGTTLFYRRRIEDMPLTELPSSPTDAQIEKAGMVRRKIAEKATSKYGFRIASLLSPLEPIISASTLVGVRFVRNEWIDGRLHATPDTVDIFAPLTISSIGSVPAPIPGIPMKGELYDYSDWNLGTFTALPRVYGVGNVVTGKGNLVASRKHAKAVASHLTDRIESILAAVENQEPLGPDEVLRLEGQVRGAQAKVGYGGDYRGWIRENTPADLL